jgi:hypothetical protein
MKEKGGTVYLQVPLSLLTAEARTKSRKGKILFIKSRRRLITSYSNVKKHGIMLLGLFIKDEKLFKSKMFSNIISLLRKG